MHFGGRRDPEVHHRRFLDGQESEPNAVLPPLPSIFARLGRSLSHCYLLPRTGDNQGPRPVGGWTASLIRANYDERLKRFNCPARRTSSRRPREGGGVWLFAKWRSEPASILHRHCDSTEYIAERRKNRGDKRLAILYSGWLTRGEKKNRQKGLVMMAYEWLATRRVVEGYAKQHRLRNNFRESNYYAR